MRKKYNLIINLISFWDHFSKLKKKQFIILFMLMILNSLLEMLSIGAVFPFIGALTSPDIVFQNQFFASIFNFFDIDKNQNFTIIFTVIFVSLILMACLVRLLVLYTLTRFSFSLGLDIGYKIYKHTLFQPFSVHANRNSSILINAIVTQTETVVFSTIIAFLTLCNSIVMLIGVAIILCIVNLYVTILSIIFFIFLYIIMMTLTKKHLFKSSENVAKEGAAVVKALQEGLGGIRDIIIDGTQTVYLKIFNQSNTILKKSMGDIQIIAGTPRFVIEAIGIIAIAIAALFASKSSQGIISTLPIIGTLALGAQRVLPVLQEAYKNLSAIKGSEASLIDVLNLLNQKLPRNYLLKNEKLVFDTSIRIKNIYFSYGSSKENIFENLNLTIQKGDRIGIIGESGVGKSTLTDILMGLLEPTNGSILVDNIQLNKNNLRSWQSQIAHVPQRIFLTDGSIYQNIAFGIDNKLINKNKLKEAAKSAQLDKFIESLPDGYNTNVGEMGMRLSGGQRQRIGIARALYKNAKIIIFDEATNSLDSKTETLIMNTIYKLDKNLTLILIAHRLGTLKKCNKVIEIGNKKIL